MPLVPALRPLLSTPMKTSDTTLIVRTAACFDPTAQFLPGPPHALEEMILSEEKGYQIASGNVFGRRKNAQAWQNDGCDGFLSRGAAIKSSPVA